MSDSNHHERTPTAILVSGRGTNLRALLDASAAGKLPHAELRLVVSNNPGAPALELARRSGVAAIAIDHRPFAKDRAAHEQSIINELRQRGIRFVVLAGYMRLLTATLIGAFRDAIINIHPSLLPAFPGVDAQAQALRHGARIAGCTVHFVNEDMDAGPIILQRTVPVLPSDSSHSLAERILAEEHNALPQAVDLFTRGRLRVLGKRVYILPGSTSFPELEPDLHAATPVLIATGNLHKAGEIRNILAGVPTPFLTTDLFPETTEPEENAPDYLGNARIKAHHWLKLSGLWTLADDSGLEVDALGGRPGVLSSRYGPTAASRNAKLLDELRDVPPEKRTARFTATVVLCGPDGREFHATGTCEGRIAFESRGSNGFGYDPIFIPDGFGGKHLAELDEKVKDSISHRCRALEKIRHHFAELA